MKDLRYPIGKFNPVENPNENEINSFINQLESHPALARQTLEGLSDEQVDTPYKTEGWTLRQIIHHISDAHINFYVRFKLALTENKPTVKLFDQVTWAELDDAKKAPVNMSLEIIEGVVARWVVLLRSMVLDDFKTELIHPEMGSLALSKLIQLCVWHGNHHISQIQSLRDRMNW
jgi:uncharacterized damage-inducible protein DinB